jgi:unsaturated rhamnogalacturonyl hydrolase
MPVKRFSIISVCIFIIAGCHAQNKSWGERMAETVMSIYPDSIVVKKYVTHGLEKTEIKPGRVAEWDYEQGVLLRGFDRLWKHTGKKAYYSYMKKNIDLFVRNDGTIRTYDLPDYNIDDIAPGCVVLSLYNETKERKYEKAAILLREQLNWQPRTKEGGFWHKHRYPYQMWLDGSYMAEPFYAEYSKLFSKSKDFTDIANQLIWMENHTRDPKTGLLFHGWDESKKQRWANQATGQSPEFWARAMGWYAMALVDVLDYFPNEHVKRQEIISIFQRLSKALRKYQDAGSGTWFQIIDKADVKGNYLEASASCMFVYAIAKGIRLGYLDKSFSECVTKGFNGVLKNFVETDAQGSIHLTKTCSGAGLGGSPYRDGSFEYYINESLRTDDLKAIGPFIQASVEVELLANKK